MLCYDHNLMKGDMLMQPQPMPGFVLAKAKTQKDIVDLGFDLPENYGKNERMAGLCEIVAVGDLTLEQKQMHAELHALVDSTNLNVAGCEAGDIVAFAPFSDLKVTIGTDEWLFIEFKSLVGNLGKVSK